MGFRTGAFATVWSVEPGKGNFTKVRLSTSRKDKESGEYVQDFSGFCMFIGTANAAASSLHTRDRIKLGDVDVTTTYNKETNKEYVNYRVFSFEPAASDHPAQAGAGGQQGAGEGENPVESVPLESDKLPF